MMTSARGTAAYERASTHAAAARLLDAIPDVFVLLDEHATVLYGNTHAARLSQRPAAELVGEPVVELLPALAPVLLPHLDEVQRRGEVRSFDVQMPHDPTWYAGHLYPAGRGGALHLHDVTARHELEDGLAFLADAGAILGGGLDTRKLMQAAANHVVPRLADWCVVYVRRQRGTRMQFVTAASTETRRQLTALAARVRCACSEDAHELASRGLLQGGALLLTADTSVDAATGRGLWALKPDSMLLVPLPGRTHSEGLLVLGRERREARFSLPEISVAVALGRRLALALQNARLHESERRAIQLRDDVLAIVAHDLRTSLHAIRLGTSALAMHSDDDDAGLNQTVRTSVLAASERMNRLIEDLLNAARLETGWGPRETSRVTAAHLVKETVASFRERAREADVGLTADMGNADAAEVVVDTGRFCEALANLIDNALKFTPRGGRVTLLAETKAGTLNLRVVDTGRGIDRESLPHLFDRFWQARHSGRAGAGLGLFITKRIVEAHGGRIRVSSEPGRGSVFHLRLPCAPPAGTIDSHNAPEKTE